MQFVINIILAVLVFLLLKWVLALVIFDATIVFLIALVVALLVAFRSAWSRYL